MGDVEIQEEAQPQARELQVGEELGFVYRKEALDGLDLHDQPIAYDEIEPQARPEGHPVVTDRHFALPAKWQPGAMKLMTQAFFVDGLEQTRSQRRMDSYPASDDHAR